MISIIIDVNLNFIINFPKKIGKISDFLRKKMSISKIYPIFWEKRCQMVKKMSICEIFDFLEKKDGN